MNNIIFVIHSSEINDVNSVSPLFRRWKVALVECGQTITINP